MLALSNGRAKFQCCKWTETVDVYGDDKIDSHKIIRNLSLFHLWQTASDGNRPLLTTWSLFLLPKCRSDRNPVLLFVTEKFLTWSLNGRLAKLVKFFVHLTAIKSNLAQISWLFSCTSCDAAAAAAAVEAVEAVVWAAFCGWICGDCNTVVKIRNSLKKSFQALWPIFL